MQIAILAGGCGTRLRPLTQKIPKAMVPIEGRPFLEYQLELLRNGGIKEVVLCIGYLGEQIERHFCDGKIFGVSISYSYEREKLLGTAGALKNAENLLNDEFFLMYGDSYLFINFDEAMCYYKKLNKLGVMVVYKNYDLYDTSNVAVEDNRVKRYSKKQKTTDMVYIDYGVSILCKRALDLIPQNCIYSLEELFGELINRNELFAYEVKERFYEVGSPQGLKEFEKYILETQEVCNDYLQNPG